ncbi:serine/threonine-protein kinase [Streptomyces johnsoniae]|uniref:non-specific serine/threonine protein kinase n=1 Tax=Streptomyces johnsoniae TaxID=3075532 RepID=A0ABU2S920_9ACTN|nr:serine/threonine-protein kinase [Streptomyces sp. DSM 41886]MDT0445476.1 serine/threonine-protein kinase [Streptomyces sp. DSM 41886]
MRPVGSKYLLEEPLGRGATGTVWRGRQREAAGDEAAVAGQPGEQVAVKVLKEELAHDPDVVMRFLRERSVLLRLGGDGHDNIVRTRDLVVEGDVIALVMDLIDGPDLHRYLYENGPLTHIAAALLTAQIADALAAAHAKGVVHRDLKPANVLLAGANDDNRPLRPMLTDFGIARLADSPGVTRAHEFVGTPSYVAPESAEGRAQTSAVDIYSAGVVLYELITGQPPFSGSSTLQVLQRHITEEPRRPDGMPGPLWTVLDCCLRKAPDERPAAAALARALRTVAAGINENASDRQRSAALGVTALLVPDASPVKVPGTGISPPGSAEPTQALPGGSGGAGGAGGADPFAATGVLPPQGSPDPGLDSTRAMPMPGASEPDGPHPWQDQMRAARDRNEPTRVQPVDPAQDPLYRAPRRQPQQPPQRRPQRRPVPPPQQAQPPQYGYQQQQYQQPQPPPQQYPQPQPQQYQRPVPPPYQEPQPRRREERPRREPREPRRSRSANPMRIPGLGCLKGCLFMVLILVIIGFLVWNFTPLQDWIADGRSFWDTVTEWFDDVREWMGLIDEAQRQGEEIQENIPNSE